MTRSQKEQYPISFSNPVRTTALLVIIALFSDHYKRLRIRWIFLVKSQTGKILDFVGYVCGSLLLQNLTL